MELKPYVYGAVLVTIGIIGYKAYRELAIDGRVLIEVWKSPCDSDTPGIDRIKKNLEKKINYPHQSNDDEF